MEERSFNEAMAEFKQQIESLPEDRRSALRMLAEETRKRAADIKKAGEAGRIAAMEFTQALGELTEANAKLIDKATDLNLLTKYAKFDAEARERELRGEGRGHDS